MLPDESKYTHENFPDNPYFHRSLARSAFMVGKLDQAMELSKDILAGKVDKDSSIKLDLKNNQFVFTNLK